MEPLYCFLDESGDPHFPAGEQGKSTHYVLGGIAVPESRLDAVRAAAGDLQREYFGKGEMKAGARSLNRDPEKRRALVEGIAALEASFVAVAVDKREVIEDGPLAKWKKSFIKYTGSQLYRRLFTAHDTVHVVADEYGTEAYQNEFGRYIEARRIPDLFLASSSFSFGDSKADPLIQVSDIVSGTIFRALRDGTDEDRALVALLRPRLHTFISWPPVFVPVEPPPRAGEQRERDAEVRDYALSQAAWYLTDHREDNAPLSVAQVATLDRLVFAAQLDEGSAFVHADEIIVGLRALGLPFAISKRWLSSEVIGPLRDAGVVITGSSRGYAIPFQASDLDEHALDVRSKAVPMLRRLSRYRADLALRTGGRIDLLASTELNDVKRLVEALDTGAAGTP